MDSAIVNVPLAKRGDINRQLDAYKAQQAALNKLESIEPNRFGVMHLCRGGVPVTFANATQAEKAAARTGGEAYKSGQSARFHVRFVGES